jgi:hypothetical protein
VNLTVTALSVRDAEDVLGELDFSAPVRVERKVRLMGRDESISEDYAVDKKTVTIAKSVNNGPAKTEAIRSESGLGNVLLLIYFLRNDSTMQEGKVYRICLPTQKFDLFVKGKRKIRVPLGVFDTFYIESKPAKYKIWLSSDANRTPVRIQGFVPVGMVYLAATSVEVRNP